MRESRFNKGDKLYTAEDEWQKLWENSNTEEEEESQNNNTSSSRYSTPSPPPLEKIDRPASILEPQLTAYDLNEEQEEEEEQKIDIVADKPPNADEEEEEEKVAHASKRRRNSPPSFLIEEAIPEESEEDLLDNNIQIIISSPIQLRSILKKDKKDKDQRAVAKKGVKFSMCDIDQSEAEENKNMEDETLFGDYDKVIVSANLAEEILNEIYGKIEEKIVVVDSSSSSVTVVDDERNDVGEDVPEIELEKERAENDGENEVNKSMADEILDELYGTNNSNKVTKDDSALIKTRHHEKSCKGK